MTIPAKEIEMVMAYSESLLGCVLVVETSGSAYGATKASDGFNTNAGVLSRIKVATGRSTSQMGTREVVVNPHVRDYTG